MSNDWRLALTQRDDSPDGGLAALVARVNASGFVETDFKLGGPAEPEWGPPEPATDYLAIAVER